jgi:very-short-patch-repair endonuclease
VDRVIGELAERQHGVVARRQLLDIGLGPRAIGARLERGYLRSLHHGAYAVGHSVLTCHARWMAAVLACGPGAVLSHRSAAALWGLLGVSGQPEVIRPGRFRKRKGIVARFGAVPADERTVRMGIPVTIVPRTILDLAGLGLRRDVQRATHEAEIRQLTASLSIPDLLVRYPRRQGAPLLRELLAEGVGFVGAPINGFEDRFANLLDRHRVPRPRFNARLNIAGRTFRPDCLWPQDKLIVELDGAKVHQTRKSFESDRERDRVLLTAGYRTMRVTWRQLECEPDALIAALRSLLSDTRAASSPK